MIEGQVVDGLFLRSWARPIELDRANQKRGCVLDLRSPITGGSTIYDVSGKGNHGTITGATWVRLPSGLWVLDFDGNDYVTMASPVFLAATWNSKFSVRLWLKVTDNGVRQTFIGCNDEASVFQLEMKAGGALAAIFNGDNVAVAPQSILSNTWAFAVVTVNGTGVGTHTFYHNGVALGTPSESGSGFSVNGAVATELGRRAAASQSLTGQMGLLDVVSRTLSASEIAQIYNQERHLFQGMTP